MRRYIPAALVLIAIVMQPSCQDATLTPPAELDPLMSVSQGFHLRDRDTDRVMPQDTTVAVNDTIRMSLTTGNGNEPQNNKNVAWRTTNAVIMSIDADRGTVVAVAKAPGTATVSATLGASTASVTFFVSAPPAHHYVVSANTYTPVAGGTVSITAQLVGAGGNPILIAGRVVAWSSTNGGSFAPTPSTTNAGGIATTTFTTSTTAGTSHVVTPTDNFGLTGSSAPIVTHAGPAANMVAYAGDAQTAQAGSSVAIPPAVRVTDAHGNAVSGVSVTFAVGLGGGSVTGANAITDAGGVAAVGSWTLGSTPGPKTLTASAPGLPTVTFTATATAGNATKLVLTTQPSSTVQAGVPFPQEPAVQLRDALNNNVAQAGVAVTAALATGSGTLAGTLTFITDASGRAQFTDTRIDGVVGIRTLRFDAGVLTPAISDPVSVVTGPASKLVIAQQPSANAQAGVAFAQQPRVGISDAFGNPASQSGVSVQAAIASGGGTLLGTTTALTDASGLASFGNLAVGGSVGIRALGFSVAGLTSATSNQIAISAGTLHHVDVSVADNAVLAGSTIIVTAQLRDAYGNAVQQAGVSVAWSSTGGGTFFVNPTATDGSGQTTVDFQVSGTAGVSHVITSTVGSATGHVTVTTVNSAPTRMMGRTTQSATRTRR